MTDLLYREDMFQVMDHKAKRARGVEFTIDYNGLWYAHGGDDPGPIRRHAMARLFGGAGAGYMAGKGLVRLDGSYYLISPEGKYPVDVEDVPFVAQQLDDSDPKNLYVITNLGERVPIDAKHPIFVAREPRHNVEILYVMVRDGLASRCMQSVFYELLSRHIDVDQHGNATLISHNHVFRLKFSQL
jgi:hypothetical protein